MSLCMLTGWYQPYWWYEEYSICLVSVPIVQGFINFEGTIANKSSKESNCLLGIRDRQYSYVEHITLAVPALTIAIAAGDALSYFDTHLGGRSASNHTPGPWIRNH